MLLMLWILVIQSIKVAYNTITLEIEKEICDHDKYITSVEFNKIMKEYFAERLKEAKLESKNELKNNVLWKIYLKILKILKF